MSDSVSVEGGKYIFEVPEGDYKVHIKRHGEPWLVLEVGSKAIFTMMCELTTARAELVDARRALDAAGASINAVDGLHVDAHKSLVSQLRELIAEVRTREEERGREMEKHRTEAENFATELGWEKGINRNLLSDLAKERERTDALRASILKETEARIGVYNRNCDDAERDRDAAIKERDRLQRTVDVFTEESARSSNVAVIVNAARYKEERDTAIAECETLTAERDEAINNRRLYYSQRQYLVGWEKLLPALKEWREVDLLLQKSGEDVLDMAYDVALDALRVAADEILVRAERTAVPPATRPSTAEAKLAVLLLVYEAAVAYERAFVDAGCRTDECSEFARNLVCAVRRTNPVSLDKEPA